MGGVIAIARMGTERKSTSMFQVEKSANNCAPTMDHVEIEVRVESKVMRKCVIVFVPMHPKMKKTNCVHCIPKNLVWENDARKEQQLVVPVGGTSNMWSLRTHQ